MNDAVLEPTVIKLQKGASGRWYHVRPTLRKGLGAAILALVALIAAGGTPHSAISAEAIATVARVPLKYGQEILSGLAGLAIMAVVLRAFHKPRSKQLQTA